jgi:hypothetical protein
MFAVNYLCKEARMRKGLIIASVLLGTVITGSAQTSQTSVSGDVHLGLPGAQVTAGQIKTVEPEIHFGRGVALVLADGSKITANEATFHASSNTVDLTGSVRLTLKPDPSK